ncbi:unnamed protein product [Sympodiomycopsis kandeliae]
MSSLSSTVIRRAPALQIQHHKWSFRYFQIKFVATIFRTLIGSSLPLAEILYQHVPKDVHVEKTTIPSRDNKRRIKVHIYTPEEQPNNSKGPDGKPPVLLNFHGSGFMIPCLGSDREYCAMLAKNLGMVVIDCDYRKAPEDPFPSAAQDAEDCLVWASEQGTKWDTSRISLSGFSAGGCLALAAAALHGDHITSVVAFYPPTSFAIPREQRKPAPQKHSGALPPSLTKFFDEAYCPIGIDRSNPLISPLMASPESFPKHVWVCCAAGDGLWHDGKALVEKLEAAGHSDAEFLNIDAEGHGFDKVAKNGTERGSKKNLAYRNASDFITRSWNDPIRGKAGRVANL